MTAPAAIFEVDGDTRVESGPGRLVLHTTDGPVWLEGADEHLEQTAEQFRELA